MGYVGVAPGTTTITLPDGRTVALSDWIDDKLYGSIQLVNGQTNEVMAFSNGRSQPIPNGTRVQTRVDTNVPRAGEAGLPKDWEMYVYGWGIKLVRAMRPPSGATQPVLADGNGALSDPVDQRTYFNLDRVIFFQYRYNNKAYTDGVMQDYPQGGGLNLVTTNAAREQVTNGIPSPRDRVALVIPVYERENLGYSGIFQPEAPLGINQPPSDGDQVQLTFVDLKLYKWGLIRRTVV
ncbi:hypothetical protein LCGC14_0522960 [marine sediment metagenome]|uniref:Uncharacterized protein n=1 Tax=marine sediment metagenome TaxID=412755 RepID=A0A0F9S2U9_9ZZZZ